MARRTDGVLDCPFPDVAEALRPYIKSRHEAGAIRRGLQATLPLSAVSPSRPPLEVEIEPSQLSGLRGSYWRALQAHQAAQSRYEALKAELDQISRTTDTPTSEESTAFLTETYIPLLQQKDRHRKLTVIESALAKIGAAGGDVATDSFDKVIKRSVGDVPAPPSTTGLSDRELGSDAEYDLTRLKKAILSVQQDLKAHQQASAQANGVADGEVDPWADLKALQKTHNELTTWMEKQLELISEGSKEGQNGAQASPDTNGERLTSMEDIEALYDEYIEARQRLLDIVSNPPDDTSGAPTSPDATRRLSSHIEVGTGPSASEILLPYISRFSLAKQYEQALLQQSGYARRQVASAEASKQALLTRLAEESHLLQPELHRGVPCGTHWGKAAEKAAKATKLAATESIKAGATSAKTAANALNAIQDMPQSLDKIME